MFFFASVRNEFSLRLGSVNLVLKRLLLFCLFLLLLIHLFSISLCCEHPQQTFKGLKQPVFNWK